MTTKLRAGFHGSGSPRWLMRALQLQGIDHAHGLALEICLLADDDRPHGTLAAVAAGEVDVADADFLAIAEARADGLPVTAIHPYGRILGSLVGRRGTGTGGLAALPGRRLGVLSRADKNWAILAAACSELAGFDLAAAAEVRSYGNRAALVAALGAGEVDHALVHWHMLPALLAAGHHLLAEIPALADAIGAPALPTTFFVVDEARVATAPASVAGFVAAATAGIRHLDADPELWSRLAAEGATPANCALDRLHQRWRGRVAESAAWNSASASALADLHTRLRRQLPASPERLPAGTFCSAFLP